MPPAPIAADPCWRVCCARSAPAKPWWYDRHARSVSHLLSVVEQLEASGAHFCSLRDPIDTSTPQGMFSLQVLGAVAHDAVSAVMRTRAAGTQELPGLLGIRCYA